MFEFIDMIIIDTWGTTVYCDCTDLAAMDYRLDQCSKTILNDGTENIIFCSKHEDWRLK